MWLSFMINLFATWRRGQSVIERLWYNESNINLHALRSWQFPFSLDYRKFTTIVDYPILKGVAP